MDPASAAREVTAVLGEPPEAVDLPRRRAYPGWRLILRAGKGQARRAAGRGRPRLDDLRRRDGGDPRHVQPPSRPRALSRVRQWNRRRLEPRRSLHQLPGCARCAGGARTRLRATAGSRLQSRRDRRLRSLRRHALAGRRQESDLDARPVNAFAAVGVLLAILLTDVVARAGRLTKRPGADQTGFEWRSRPCCCSPLFRGSPRTSAST